MLAGRKLLLADDSITIQKVVALTFADEGVEVVTVGDGREAIEKLQGITPDIVLADVFMPKANGYEVCEYIKQNAKLKHIPVMLLVGSFEPFDEVEARRVGADDILTKPFQSIRRLIDKVGGLVGNKAADEATTAELPHVHEEAAEPEKLSTGELEISTADTQRLPLAKQHPDYPAFEPAAVVQESDYRSYAPVVETQLPKVVETELPKDVKQANFRESQIMDSPSYQLRNDSTLDQGDVLLDLGDLRTSAVASDDFVLDLDFGEPQSVPAVGAAAVSESRSFVEPQLSRSDAALEVAQRESSLSSAWMDTSELARRQQGLPSTSEGSSAGMDQKFVDTQEWMRESPHSTTDELQSKGTVRKLERVTDEPGDVAPSTGPIGPVSLDQLSPEVIDAIARRAVEQLSARVVQEIAWEVVPQLAELLIKRKLEESQSRPK
ncbi:MAG: response regulator [Pyrinomonadaceae bacterium]|nr:response regulator [Pyrinomonadaceae bacterium]